ncbi:MAG TPA: TSUP family transporter, partial [Bryobacteraceae bacterium]
MPHLAPWQWLLGTFCAFMIGVAKTGAPGVGSMIAPLMVLTVGDARLAAAWTLPVLSTADIFAVAYWRKKAEARQLFSLIPWVLAGIVGGAMALSLDELVIRRIIGAIIIGMVVIYLWRRWNPERQVAGNPAFYGICTG